MVKKIYKILLLIILMINSCVAIENNPTVNEIHHKNTEALKGISYNNFQGNNCNEIIKLRGLWFYNWWHTTNCNIDLEFVPMIFSHYQTIDEIINNIISQKPEAVFTWNEPTVIDQANLPLLNNSENIDRVMSYWEKIDSSFGKTAIKISSPAFSSQHEDAKWENFFY